MKKTIQLLTIILLMHELSACAADRLRSPCPHFGANCHKALINNGEMDINLQK